MLIGVSLHVPPPKWLALSLTAEKLLVFLLRFIHFQEVIFGQVLSFDQLVHVMVTNSWIVCCVFWWLAQHISVRYTCKVYRFEHSSDDATKFLVRNVIFLGQLADFVLIQDRPEALTCWKITVDMAVCHDVISGTTFEQFCKKTEEINVITKMLCIKNVCYN